MQHASVGKIICPCFFVHLLCLAFWQIIFPLSLSLSLSLFLTHTHSLFLSLSFSLTHSLFLYLSFYSYHSHTLLHSSYSNTHTTHTQIFTHSLENGGCRKIESLLPNSNNSKVYTTNLRHRLNCTCPLAHYPSRSERDKG